MKTEIEVREGRVEVEVAVKPFFGGKAERDRVIVYVGDAEIFEDEDALITAFLEVMTHETLHAVLFRYFPDVDDDFEEVVSDVAAASVDAPAGMDRGDVYYWLRYGKNVGDLFTLP